MKVIGKNFAHFDCYCSSIKQFFILSNEQWAMWSDRFGNESSEQS